MKPLICLASQSPRRKALLENLGLALQIQPAAIDETPKSGELPADYALRLAIEKAKAVTADCPIVAADTIVTIDQHILEKPNDYADFRRMMGLLSGREHQVMTGWCVRTHEHMIARVTTTSVRFQTLSEPSIQPTGPRASRSTKRAVMAFKGSPRCGLARSRGITTTWSVCRYTK